MKKCYGLLHKGESIEDFLFTNAKTHMCKACAKEYAARRYKEKKNLLNAQSKRWKELNKEKVKARDKDYRDSNKDKRKEISKEYFTKIENRVWARVAKRVYQATAYQGVKAFAEVGELIGCDKHTLYAHLKSSFKPGMGEKNYGDGRLKWQVDHILPIISFDLSSVGSQKAAFHYTNLQPLWSTENHQKGWKTDFKLLPTSSHTSKKTDDEDTLRLAC